MFLYFPIALQCTASTAKMCIYGLLSFVITSFEEETLGSPQVRSAGVGTEQLSMSVYDDCFAGQDSNPSIAIQRNGPTNRLSTFVH